MEAYRRRRHLGVPRRLDPARHLHRTSFCPLLAAQHAVLPCAPTGERLSSLRIADKILSLARRLADPFSLLALTHSLLCSPTSS